VKALDEAMGEKTLPSEESARKAIMLASFHIFRFSCGPFFVTTTESGKATCPSTLAPPSRTRPQTSVVLTMVVAKLSSSTASPEPTSQIPPGT